MPGLPQLRLRAPAKEKGHAATVTLRAALTCRFSSCRSPGSLVLCLGLTPGFSLARRHWLAWLLVCGTLAWPPNPVLGPGPPPAPAAGWVAGFLGGSAVVFAAGFAGSAGLSVRFGHSAEVSRCFGISAVSWREFGRRERRRGLVSSLLY